MTTPLADRPDIDDARRRAHISLDSHEARAMERALAPGETVDALARGHDGPAAGLVVLTDRRLLVVVDQRFDHHVREWAVGDLTSVHWAAGTSRGALHLFTAKGTSHITGVDGRSGRVIADALRARLAPPSPEPDAAT